jgi:hypothetical protein
MQGCLSEKRFNCCPALGAAIFLSEPGFVGFLGFLGPLEYAEMFNYKDFLFIVVGLSARFFGLNLDLLH